MAQTTAAVNLSSAVIPFVSAGKGQSVIIANRGDMTAGPNRDFGGDTLEAASNVPQLYWAENVMPTQEGYHSVGYMEFVPAITPALAADNEIQYEMTVFDGDGNKAILAVTEQRDLYCVSGANPTWAEITIPGTPWTTGNMTVGVAYGTVYVFFPVVGLHTLDIATNTLTKVTPAGLDESVISGIASANSYLIAFNPNTIAWSSATDPLDFVPSLTTGAGAGTPEGLLGQIVHVKAINKGFIIYSSVNTMAGEYTANVQFPWLFRPLNNGSGIASFLNVTQDNSLAAHFAWMAAGLMEVNMQVCTPRFPQATDFLSGRVWEEFVTETKRINRQYLQGQLRVRLAFIAARFLCLSYGKPESQDYEYVLVYDSALQRWGRLRFTHRQCLEIVADTEFDPTTWEELDEDEWDDLLGSWSSFVQWNNNTAKPKQTIGFLTAQGSINVAMIDWYPNGTQGVALLGRYQLVRGHKCFMQGMIVQGVDKARTDFTVTLLSTGDGATVNVPLKAPHLAEDGDFIRNYASRVAGKSHSILFQGSFHLCSLELILTDAGRR